MENLAVELAPIRVDLVAPGFVDTPLSAALLGAQLVRQAELDRGRAVVASAGAVRVARAGLATIPLVLRAAPSRGRGSRPSWPAGVPPTRGASACGWAASGPTGRERPVARDELSQLIVRTSGACHIVSTGWPARDFPQHCYGMLAYMKRTTLKIPDALDARLRHEAQRRGMTISELSREALEAHLGTGSRRRWLGAAKAGRSGVSDVSERIEEILAAEARR